MMIDLRFLGVYVIFILVIYLILEIFIEGYGIYVECE